MDKIEYDLTEVIRQYNNGNILERRELVKQITYAMRDNPQVLDLTGRVAFETVEKGLAPVQTIQFSLMTGMVIGILLEKERSKKLIV